MTENSAATAASRNREGVARLRAILRECGSVCVGYSGGVDSVLLAVMSVRELGAANVLAVTGLSPAYPEVQRETAARCARDFSIPHLEVPTHELEDERYASNPANRCYYCKSELWPTLIGVARERGLAVVLDGSNADDAHDYRPGFAAAREHDVRSPLLEAGLTKGDVRALSRELGLPTWDQPSAPCLSSRLPYGVAVTPERLRQVELAESELRRLGFRELRVRHHDDCLRIELGGSELDQVIHRADAVVDALAREDGPRIVIDVEGYRRGALNEVLVQLGTPSRTAAAPPPASPRALAESPLPSHDIAGFHRDIAVVDLSMADARAAAPAFRAAGFKYVAVAAEALVPALHD